MNYIGDAYIDWKSAFGRLKRITIEVPGFIYEKYIVYKILDKFYYCDDLDSSWSIENIDDFMKDFPVKMGIININRTFYDYIICMEKYYRRVYMIRDILYYNPKYSIAKSLLSRIWKYLLPGDMIPIRAVYFDVPDIAGKHKIILLDPCIVVDNNNLTIAKSITVANQFNITTIYIHKSYHAKLIKYYNYLFTNGELMELDIPILGN